MSQSLSGQTKEQAAELLQSLKTQVVDAMNASDSRKALYELKVEFLGKSGKLTGIMKEMAALPKEEKPAFGKAVNEVKSALEELYEKRDLELGSREIEAKMQAEEIDLSLTASPGTLGTEHPVQKVMNEIVTILSKVGYCLKLGPAVEKDYYNFEALNLPANHPARDMQDTFFVDDTHVLRTHTSPVWSRALEKEKPPFRILGGGAVFRVDSDISHLPHFHQFEGVCVDEKVSMADLKGTITYFVREFFGPGLKTRFRPSYFPFTEPSAEVDCTCPVCRGGGCALCKQSGWIEIGGCGLIHPKVFEKANMEYPRWQGFAWGFGVERMAIIKYGIDDIRLIPENDLRFLGQFPS